MCIFQIFLGTPLATLVVPGLVWGRAPGADCPLGLPESVCSECWNYPGVATHFVFCSISASQSESAANAGIIRASSPHLVIHSTWAFQRGSAVNPGIIQASPPSSYFTVLGPPRVSLQWMLEFSGRHLPTCIFQYLGLPEWGCSGCWNYPGVVSHPVFCSAWASQSGSAVDAGIIWASSPNQYSTPGIVSHLIFGSSWASQSESAVDAGIIRPVIAPCYALIPPPKMVLVFTFCNQSPEFQAIGYLLSIVNHVSSKLLIM
jgi:hypothetical protein